MVGIPLLDAGAIHGESAMPLPDEGLERSAFVPVAVLVLAGPCSGGPMAAPIC